MVRYNTVQAVVDSKRCTGCGVCEQACPFGAVELRETKEGFLEPFISCEVCVGCGKCVKSCHAVCCKGVESRNGYAMLSGLSQRNESASGGVFYEIARCVLLSGGIVYGAAFDKGLNLRHVKSEDLASLRSLQGSKYVQSDTRFVFSEIEAELKRGTLVLFSGTPCQVAGLKSYLRHYYDNLYCIDIVCHGVPSPGLWRDYVEYLGTIYSCTVLRVSFRIKTKYDKSAFALIVETENGTYRRDASQDLFYSLFLRGLTFRECCYSCRYATASNRPSDITIGDCASCGLYNSMPAHEALSTVLINTDHGVNLLDRYGNGLLREQLDMSMETQMNEQLHKPFPKPEGRDRVYQDYRDCGFSYMESKYLSTPSIKNRVIDAVKKRISVKTRAKMKQVLRSIRGSK